jgi:hypothetical protein
MWVVFANFCNGNLCYYDHILKTDHTYGNITDNMDITKQGKRKGIKGIRNHHIRKICKTAYT